MDASGLARSAVEAPSKTGNFMMNSKHVSFRAHRQGRVTTLGVWTYVLYTLVVYAGVYVIAFS
jgi:hypothetical protein